MKKLLSQTNIKIIPFLIAAAIFVGCGKEKPREDFVARVDDTYLSDGNISSDIDTAGLQPSHRNEYIRNWIETELLYKAAVKEDVLDDKEFQRILNKSKKELARAFLINKLIEENPIEFKPGELEKYYLDHKNEFRIFHDAYLYNAISFSDEDKAILFRSSLIESDWTRATAAYHNEKTILSERPHILEGDYEIQPRNLFLLIQDLLPNEASIVLNTEPGKFTVVQLIKKYLQNEIPEFEVIKETVKDRFLTEKKHLLIDECLQKLYTKHQVEIKPGK